MKKEQEKTGTVIINVPLSGNIGSNLCEYCLEKEAKGKFSFVTESKGGLCFRWFTCSYTCAMCLLADKISKAGHKLEKESVQRREDRRQGR